MSSIANPSRAVLMLIATLAGACERTAVDIANDAGIPPVTPGSAVAGPLDGPEGTIYYANALGLVSIWIDEGPVAVFADANKQLVYFAATPIAQYAAQNGQLVQVPQLPGEVQLFPHANGLAQGLIKAAERLQRSGGDADVIGYEAASAMSKRIHETNLTIISNIGGEGCTANYEDGAYVGCW